MKTFALFTEELEASLFGTPEELLEDDNDAAEWHKKHPVDHMNIVHHWNQATPEEHKDGRNWYKHASHYVGILAKDSGISKTQMAGLTANYSPQTDWHSNMLHAARVAKYGHGIGGPNQERHEGRAMMASEHQRKAADAIFAGKHYNDVLKGHKIRHFAHLIEHGGDGPDTAKPHVCVDRHAYSVAAGARMSDKAFQKAKLSGKKTYDHVADAYAKAADHINKAANTPHGHPDHVAPHHVQAVTWLTRQRLNDEEDHKKRFDKPQLSLFDHDPDKAGWGKNRVGSKERWNKYARVHHPTLA